MNKYKKKMLTQLLLMLGVTFVAVVVTIALFLSEFSEYTVSFMCGLSFSFIAIDILILVNYIRITKDPERLRKEAIKDADERNALIQQKVQAMSFRVFVMIIALITTILAFYDVKTMFMMSGILWLALIVKLLLFAYYKRKL